MRITIEIDPLELQPSVKVEKTQGQALLEKATDAGGPPAFLVEALGEKKEPEPDTAQTLEQDAGPGPAWPAKWMEGFFSLPDASGNGA